MSSSKRKLGKPLPSGKGKGTHAASNDGDTNHKSSSSSSSKGKQKTREAAFKKQLESERQARLAKLSQSQQPRGAAAAEQAQQQSAAGAVKRAMAQVEKARAAAASSLSGRERREKKRREEDEAQGGVSKFRYRSFNERLAGVKLDRLNRDIAKVASGLDPLLQKQRQKQRMEIDSDDEDDEDRSAAPGSDAAGPGTGPLSSSLYATSFGSALSTWKELNLSLPFVDFARFASPLSESLPLLLHHRDELVDLMLHKLLRPVVESPAQAQRAAEPAAEQEEDEGKMEGVEGATAEAEAPSSAPAGQHHAYAPAFDLIPRLALDLGGAEYFASPSSSSSSTTASTSTTTAASSPYTRLLERVLYLAAALASDQGGKWTGGDTILASDLVEQAFACATALVKICARWLLDTDDDASAPEASAEALGARERTRQETWAIFRTFLGHVAQSSTAVEQQDSLQAEAEEESGASGSEGDDDEDDDEPHQRANGNAGKKGAKPTAAPRKVPVLVRRFASEALAHLARLAITTDRQAAPGPRTGAAGGAAVMLARTMLADFALTIEAQHEAERALEALRGADAGADAEGAVEAEDEEEDELEDDEEAEEEQQSDSRRCAVQVKIARKEVEKRKAQVTAFAMGIAGVWSETCKVSLVWTCS